METASQMRFWFGSIPKSRTADTFDMTVTDSQFDLLVKMLDATALRHRVIAQNVANVNTPGYHRQEVEFEETLARQLGRGGEGSALHIVPKIVTHKGDDHPDGNNLDVDMEMGELNKNALLYSTYIQVLSNRLAMMRSAITGH